ncbi:NVEALA domain-containing protein [Parabacteroides bouchesdurhonensis]|uniref:NVEALA domain-containing protein n=1 Tax=Parabacteroides bouchesdurhonensis TaxID=1936995 RepID=UPI000C86407D|nr:NVEALA domain-containing protein [Parabacteroides bouchesdurhonensis]RHJ92980.1 hypothetical protein DW095_06390 [Bacteroides sp. AM07-16]
MKVIKILFGILFFISIYFYAQQKNKALNEITFSNVEALAGGEGGSGTHCVGSGNVECMGYNVEYKITGYSLDYEE